MHPQSTPAPNTHAVAFAVVIARYYRAPAPKSQMDSSRFSRMVSLGTRTSRHAQGPGSTCRVCGRHGLHSVPFRRLVGSKCRVCWQQSLHSVPCMGPDGSRCRVCWRQSLHPAPSRGTGGSKCRVCRQQSLHAVPSREPAGPKCRVCWRQMLHLEPFPQLLGSTCRVCRQQMLHSSTAVSERPSRIPRVNLRKSYRSGQSTITPAASLTTQYNRAGLGLTFEILRHILCITPYPNIHCICKRGG